VACLLCGIASLKESIEVSQGTGTGRGIIAGISLQAMSHISLAMMAGSRTTSAWSISFAV
jgi:hypothetical protein